MNIHENVILDLLPAVRSGHASAESRKLVEEFLEANPQIAKFAALMPTPDPSLEMRTLQRTRQELDRAGWQKGLAIFCSLLPLSFVFDGSHLHLLFADYPVVMIGLWIAAGVLWSLYFMRRQRSLNLR
jgi:hypothetical protein